MKRSMMLVAALAAAIPAMAFAQQGRPAQRPGQNAGEQAREKAAEQGQRGMEKAQDKGKGQEMRAEHAAHAMDAGFYAMTTCPVSGQPLGDGAVTKIYDGREVRFCCDDCPARFEEDQAAFMATMDAKLIAEQRWDWPLTTCPVSGHELGEGGEPVEMIVGTRFVKLCCDGCIEDFRANSAQYFKEIDKAIADAQRDDYPLTTCVISGEELGSMGEPVEIVIGTTLVRLCCKGCLPKVAKAPWDTLKKVHAAR
ncbi:MAG: hypothetical protein ACF8QF_07995 [Phycisphaerales bacterium]